MGERPYWRVAVSIDGEKVLAIEPRMLSGIPDIDKYADEVRTCAQHLLGFIGGADEEMTMPDLTTVTDEDVERVARGMYDRQTGPFKQLKWDDVAIYWRHLARAAIEAFLQRK